MSKTLLYFLGLCYCICSTAQNLLESDYTKNMSHKKEHLKSSYDLTKNRQIKAQLQSEIEYDLKENSDYTDQSGGFKDKNWHNYINLLSAFFLCAIFMLLISVIFI